MNMKYSFAQNDESKIEINMFSSHKKKKVGAFIGIGLLCLFAVLFPFLFFGCAAPSGETDATSYTVTWKVGGLSNTTYGRYNGGLMSYNSTYGSVIGTIGGRKYYHRYSEFAYMGIAYEQVSGTSSWWTFPIVISKTKTGAQYYCDHCVSNGIAHCCSGVESSYGGYIWFNVLNNRWYGASTYSSATTYVQKWYYYGGSHAMQTSNGSATPASTYVKYYKATNNDSLEQTALDLMQTGQSVTTTQTASAKVTMPTVAPRREGYTFLGWYTSQTGALGTRITTSTTYTWTANKTFYARFRPNYYQIEFETYIDDGPTTIGGITVSAGSMVSYATLHNGCSEYFEGLSYVTEPFELAFTWSGSSMTFLPESLDASGIYYHEFFEMCHGYVYELNSFMLTAQLTRERCTYDISVSYTDGQRVWEDGNVGLDFTETFIMPSYAPTKTGYTFNGWYLDIAGFTSTLYSLNQTIYIETIVNQVCSSKPFSYIQDTEDLTLWFLPKFTINTYRLTIDYNTYYDECVHGTDIWVETYWETSIVRDERVWINRTYSTTPLTIKVHVKNLNYEYYMQWYVDGSWGGGTTNGSITFNWTPTANVNVKIDVIERFSFKAATSEGVALAEAKSLWDTSSSWSSNTEWGFQGTGLSFKAGLKDGYVFDGWYKGSTKVSGNMEFTYLTNANPGGGGLRENLTLTAKAKKIYDRLYYNSTDKYFYFTDGLYPQSYTYWDLTNTLSTQYSNGTLTAEYFLAIAGQKSPVVKYGNNYYARIWNDSDKNIKISEGGSVLNFGKSYFWFKLEPIVWRVSDYGVSVDYYSDVLYDRFETDGGVIYGVSDLVLDYGQVDSAINKETGWKYGSSEMYRNNSSNYASLSAEFFYGAVGTWSFDQIGDGSTNSKIVSYDRNVLGLVQASVKDIDRLFQPGNYATATNGKNYNVHNTTLQTSVRSAKASDLVCMLLGVDYDEYASYTTRDLFDNSNSFRVLPYGAKNNRFFDNSCGVRLAYAVNGKSGTTNMVTLATGRTFNETLKRAVDSAATSINFTDQSVGMITFGKLNAQEKYYNSNHVEITSSNPYIDVSSALNVSIKAYITEGADGLKDIYVLSDKYIMANADSDALFHAFSKLKDVRFDNFLTTNVTNFDFFFNGCFELEVDVSNFDTVRATTMENMFANVDNERLILSNFVTTNVTNMSSMFSICENLEVLDFSSFNTSKVVDMSDMLLFNTNLKTIYVGTNWSTTAVTSSTRMFNYCNAIVGGNGTTYNSSYVDKTYARVDKSGTPGYLTLKS